MSRRLLVGALLLGCTGLSGCTAAAIAGIETGLTVGRELLGLDTEFVKNLRARKDASGNPKPKGADPASTPAKEPSR